ncbi:MAG TPA: proteasome activator, partial [Actinomycetota bacterium]|nr:proteasome activator [Actinomycetota bacterium]
MPETEERNGLIVVREPEQEQRPGEAVDHPAKLLRIAAMTRQLLEEVRHAPLDERSRDRLKEIYSSSLEELRGALSEDLQRELATLTHPLDKVPSESEIRVAQAQLVGWLEGLFHGVQAALWTQAVQAQAQFRAMPHRPLPGGGVSGRGRGEKRA